MRFECTKKQGYIAVVNEAHWYQLQVEEVLKKLDASSGGLASSEAQERLKKFGHLRRKG